MLTFPATLPEDDDDDEDFLAPATSTGLALVVCWCREEPWRVGELLLVTPGTPGPVVLFGRGPSTLGEPPKAPLGQLRLGSWLPSPPLGGTAVSRYQLELQALADDRLHVRNAGRCPLLINERSVESGEL